MKIKRKINFFYWEDEKLKTKNNIKALRSFIVFNEDNEINNTR